MGHSGSIVDPSLIFDLLENHICAPWDQSHGTLTDPDGPRERSQGTGPIWDQPQGPDPRTGPMALGSLGPLGPGTHRPGPGPFVPRDLGVKLSWQINLLSVRTVAVASSPR